MTLYEKLKIERQKAGLSQKELAEKLNMNLRTYGSYERGERDVSTAVLLNICKVLSISSDYLLGREDTNTLNADHLTIDELNLSDVEKSHIKKYRKLDTHGKKMVDFTLNEEYDRCTYIETQEEQEEPTIQIEYSCLPASAGTGDWLSDENIELRDIPDSPTARKADLAIPVDGDSMEPQFYNGDVLLVHKQPTINEGEIGVFIVNGSGYVKKFGGDRLISLNNKYNDIHFCENDSIICVGKVLGTVDN